MRFEDLDLNNNVLDALYDMRFDECTPVQEKCIPEILKGNDVLGVAQTGTGKTAAYLLPILSKIDDGGFPEKAINCIIMSPTRELAQQIDQAMQGFGYYLNGVSSVAVYGGNDGNRYDQELKSLRLGADIVIATPGRLISHISLGNVDLSKVSFFVLDEADRMLDMGFSEDIITIAKKLPQSCQTIMFSATMPKKIEDLAKTLLKNPIEIKLAVSKPAEKIKQSAYICFETQKMGIINDIFKAGDLKRVIIFCGSKIKVKQVACSLLQKKIKCGEMHSDLDQATRDDAMFKFKSGQFDVLVATDIVARGIDIDDIAMVINYDVPHDAEDYVHRIGRTARAERDGVAITLVGKDDMFYFQQIEKFLETSIAKNELPAELGNGPEYLNQGKPSKKKPAKTRRREDRDTTYHKDSKRHHSNYDNQNARPAQRNAQTATPDDQTRNGEPNYRSNNRRRNYNHDANDDNRHNNSNRNYNRNRNNGYNSDSADGYAPRNGRTNDNSQSQNTQNQKSAPRQNQPKKRRGNVEGNYKKRQKQQVRSSDAPQQKTSPVKKENGIKKFIKKIFGFKK